MLLYVVQTHAKWYQHLKENMETNINQNVFFAISV